jgi:protein O-GlcNAc transferase
MILYYEALALRLAQDPGTLTAAKARLVQNRSSAARFDPERFWRHLEAAYIAMWQRMRCGHLANRLRCRPLPIRAVRR